MKVIEPVYTFGRMGRGYNHERTVFYLYPIVALGAV